MHRGWYAQKNRHSLAASGVKTKEAIKIPSMNMRLKINVNAPLPIHDPPFDYDDLLGKNYAIPYTEILVRYETIEYMKNSIVNEILNGNDKYYGDLLTMILMLSKFPFPTIFGLDIKNSTRFDFYQTIDNIHYIIDTLPIDDKTKQNLHDIYKNKLDDFERGIQIDSDKVVELNKIPRGGLSEVLEKTEKHLGKNWLDKNAVHPLFALYLMAIQDGYIGDIITLYPLLTYSIKDLLYPDIERAKKDKEYAAMINIYRFLSFHSIESTEHRKFRTYSENTSIQAGDGHSLLNKKTPIFPMYSYDYVLKHKSEFDSDYPSMDRALLYHAVTTMKYSSYPDKFLHKKMRMTVIEEYLFDELSNDLGVNVFRKIQNATGHYTIRAGHHLKKFNQTSLMKDGSVNIADKEVKNGVLLAINEVFFNQKPSKRAFTNKTSKEIYENIVNIFKEIDRRRAHLLSLYKSGKIEKLDEEIQNIMVRNITTNDVYKSNIVKALYDPEFGISAAKMIHGFNNAPRKYEQNMRNARKNILENKAIKYHRDYNRFLSIPTATSIVNEIRKSDYYKSLSDKHREEIDFILNSVDKDLVAQSLVAVAYIELKKNKVI